MKSYDPGQTLRAARDRYFAENDFGANGGYDDPWMHVKVGPLPMIFPNTKARKRAVRFHDLHHIVTGYETTLAGEYEISAWELASGCADMWAAWQLNLAGLFAGLFTSPRRVVRAFVRGRRSMNFYRRPYDDTLLDLTVEEARRELGLDPAPSEKMTPADGGVFVAYAAAGLVSSLVLMTIIVPLIPLGIALSMTRPRGDPATPSS